MQQLARDGANMEYNAGHYARYSGAPLDPAQSPAWVQGWRKANAELTRPAWL